MQTHLICYADEQMSISQQLCIASAKDKGKIDHVYSFGPNSIDKFFRDRHKSILEAPQRGGGKGFWLWKPYIVEQAIRNLPEKDVLIYCDSGVEWLKPASWLIERMWNEGYEGENDVFLFSNGHRHIDWCKAEVIASMFRIYPKDIKPHLIINRQVQASVMLFRINEYTRDFCARWLAWSCIPGFIDDSFNPALQLDEFREHRNDQSILTNLAIEDEVPLHWWPAQYWQSKKADFPRDNYPQMFYHHRLRNEEWYNQYEQDMPINEMLTDFSKRYKNI